MNIFKVLNSGDGRLTEPNLSAFLGYLLNPKEDHGLNSLFLQKVLEPFLRLDCRPNPLQPLFSSDDNNEENRRIFDLSIQSRFNVDVVLEKAVKFDEKSIIDIIIIITERRKNSDKKEDLSYLFRPEEPVAILLIENKIRKGWEEIQIINQYKNSLNYLPKSIITDKLIWNKWKDKICSVLICPFENDLENRVSNFKKNKGGNEKTIFLAWKNSKDSIKSILQTLLSSEIDGSIPPIPSYTSTTIKALINFIENDFRSDSDDKKAGGKQIVINSFDTWMKLKESGLIINDPYADRVEGLYQEIEKKLPKKEYFISFSPTHLASFYYGNKKTKGNKMFHLSDNLNRFGLKQGNVANELYPNMFNKSGILSSIKLEDISDEQIIEVADAQFKYWKSKAK